MDVRVFREGGNGAFAQNAAEGTDVVATISTLRDGERLFRVGATDPLDIGQTVAELIEDEQPLRLYIGNPANVTLVASYAGSLEAVDVPPSTTLRQSVSLVAPFLEIDPGGPSAGTSFAWLKRNDRLEMDDPIGAHTDVSGKVVELTLVPASS